MPQNKLKSRERVKKGRIKFSLLSVGTIANTSNLQQMLRNPEPRSLFINTKEMNLVH